MCHVRAVSPTWLAAAISFKNLHLRGRKESIQPDARLASIVLPIWTRAKASLGKTLNPNTGNTMVAGEAYKAHSQASPAPALPALTLSPSSMSC